jgi:PAS domain S-box-containing protein
MSSTGHALYKGMLHTGLSRLMSPGGKTAATMSASFHEQILDSMKVMVCRTTRDGTVTFVNKALCNLARKNKEEMTGVSLLKLIPANSIQRVKKLYALMNREPHSEREKLLEERIMKDKVLSIEWTAEAVFNENSELSEIQWTGIDVTANRSMERAITRGTALLNAANYAVQRLLKAERWQDEINNLLGHLGRAVDVNRVYVFEFHEAEDGTRLSSQRFEWVAPGIEPQIGAPYLQNIPYEFTPFKEWVETISKGVIIHGHVKDLSEEESSFFTPDIKSFIFMPFFVLDRLWGWIGFDICFREHTPTEDEVALFKTVADALSIALEHATLEKKLELSRNFLDKIINHMVEPLFVKDHLHRWILINDSYCALTGFTREQLIGKSDHDFYKKEEADTFWEKDEMVLSSGFENINDEPFTDAKGVFHIIRTKKSLYKDWEDRKFIVGVISDVTEQFRLENLLRESERNFRLLAEQASDVIARHDSEGRFIYIPPSAISRFGFVPEDVLGRLPSEFAHPEDRAQIHEKLADLARGEECVTFQYRWAMKDGSYCWFETSLRGVIEESRGGIKEIISVTRDISERKHVEEEMKNALARERELNELKSRFMSMTSHEFGTPLCTITLSTELILKYWDKFEDEKKLHYVRQILDCTSQMSALMDDILLMGKSDAGKIDFVPSPVNLDSFCRELIEGTTASRDACSRVRFINGCRKKIIKVDEKLLRHILLNLLTNALKYSPEYERVNFTITCGKKEITFIIEDKGMGIPLEDQTYIFDPFHRGKNVTPIKGTGLGLAIVKKSVDSHGGTISFKSTPGSGAAFTVTLPLS